MTQNQILYFLTTARCLNFTEAAKQLYISQPALSQQISTIEKELNMQLFIRDKKKVYLTPAACILLEELPKYNRYYEQILEDAKQANAGNNGALSIAVMEDQCLAQCVIEQYHKFRRNHPGIAIRPTTASFGQLKKMLFEDKVDLIYTVDFEIEDIPTLVHRKVAFDHAFAAISKNHPLASIPITSLSQLKSETFILLSDEESAMANKFILNDCKKAGFYPRIHYVNSISEAIIHTELGLGVSIVNHENYTCYNPNIKILELLSFQDRAFAFAWKKTNTNPAIPLFINSFTEFQ